MARTIHDITVDLTPNTPCYPGKIPLSRDIQSRISDGAVANCSSFNVDCHYGTHVDSPNHFVKNGITIEQVDLDRLCGECVVIEIVGKREILPSDLELLQPSSRVLFKSLGSNLLASGEFDPAKYPYLTADAAILLVDLNTLCVGIDAFSVDAFGQADDAHNALLPAGIPIIECLNLTNVEPGSYQMAILPLKIVGAEAAPARAMLWRDSIG